MTRVMMVRTSAIKILRKAFAMDESTPTRSNSIVDGLSFCTETTRSCTSALGSGHGLILIVHTATLASVESNDSPLGILPGPMRGPLLGSGPGIRSLQPDEISLAPILRRYQDDFWLMARLVSNSPLPLAQGGPEHAAWGRPETGASWCQVSRLYRSD